MRASISSHGGEPDGWLFTSALFDMRIVGLRLICHHFFLSTIRSSRKSLRILYHSVLNKGQCKSQHETGEGVQLSMSFFADAYPRQIDVLTHISPFWRTYESNDKRGSNRRC